MQVACHVCFNNIDQVRYGSQNNEKIPVALEFVPIALQARGTESAAKRIDGIGVAICLRTEGIFKVIVQLMVVPDTVKQSQENTIDDGYLPILPIVDLT